MSDLTFAWRTLQKSPGFAITAVLTLALSIGATTAVFTIVNAALLAPLPYPQPDRLAYLARVYEREGVRIGHDTAHDGKVWLAVRDGLSKARAAVFSGGESRVNLAAGDRAMAVVESRVSAGYFGVLGVGPVLGRELVADEDRAGGPRAVILSDRLWRGVFGAEPDLIGKAILLRGEPHTVVGVMPAGFRGITDADLWTPLQPSTSGEGGGQNYTIVLRLADGVAWPELDAEAGATVDPVFERKQTASGAAITHGVIRMQEGLTAGTRQPLLMLTAAVGFVLAVAVVNLAGLLLARAGIRRREIATRLAMGASRRAIVRQLLVESLLVACIGGGLGLAVAWFGVGALHGLAADVFVASWVRPALDWRVLGVAAGLTIFTGLAFGLVPALQSSRVDVRSALAWGGTRSVAGTGGGWPRRLLVVTEVALGVVLLVAAGLLIRTFIHLQTLSPGFDPRNLVTASASLDDARYRERESVARLIETSLLSARALPGAESAAVSLGLPYERILNTVFRFVGGGQVEGSVQITNVTYVSDGYFETLRIPLRRGRPLDGRDSAASRPVVVVNEAFIREYVGDRDPLTQALALSGAERQIVGVVGDVQQVGGSLAPIAVFPTVFVPVGQVPPALMNLAHTWFAPAWIVRQRAPGLVTESMLRELMADVDPRLPWASMSTFDALRSRALARERLLMALVAMLGIAALMLSAIGIHGLIASGVAERMRELGIRLALGATAGQVMRSAALPGIALALAGLLAGSVLAYASTGLLRGLLWGVAENDALTFAAVGAVLLAVATAASVLPALRTRRFDPATLLRD
jgi:predicted permease